MKKCNVIGLTVFAFGALALIGFGVYKFSEEFFKSSEIPVIVKFGISALIVGTIIMLISLIFERIGDKKEEL